ncbi:lactose-binding lectin l-2-like [Odontesthes bonariensis]|uniref:lactose-binding lectin l-2-like n=1 Tax=Odontesthes bonariensis TaxID=219752 RepID=UPI003F5865E8
MLLLFLIGLALGAVTPSDVLQGKLQRGNCPMFWYSFNGRCYKYISTDMTWAEAELQCVAQGANLVSIHSVQEDDFVKLLIKNFDHNEGLTWIGLSDLHYEGKWMWSDGSKADTFFWSVGEPTNEKGIEHCVHTNFGQDRKWNDTPCSDYYPGVCATRSG